MSKLSFRARALDASKPMPIYLAEELPDLPDYSAINRAVPQMPSGMEKEEESEHHLQRAISGTGLIIPTPEVCEVTDLEFYERCYPPDYKMPKQHIHMQPLWEEQEAPEYDIDSEDERWLKQQRHPELTELLFEQMMDKLERCSGQTVVTLSEAKLLLERKHDLVIAVYDYWLNKRLNTQHALILSVKTESRPGQSTNNPYLAFRRRTEKMQTRKNRKNDESSYEKMLKLRRDLARALTLLQLVARREQAKRDLVQLTATLANRRYVAGDFATHLLPEPQPRPVYSCVPPAAGVTRREPFALHYPPRATPTPTDLPRQREKRPYKRRKHRHHAVGAAHALRDGVASSGGNGAASSSEEECGSPPDPGPFAFRRKPGCYYELPTSTLCGDPLDADRATKDVMYEHEIDERHRYTLTSISHPYPQCIGFARRRVGRGGRVILDRVPTPLDSLWSRLDFNPPHSTAYKQQRDEEVEFETKAHRYPKEMTRDYHTSGKYPWRHAFRQHLSKNPELWLDDVKPDVDDAKIDVDGIKMDADAIKIDVDGLKVDVDGIKMDVDDVKLDVDKFSDLPQDSDISLRTISDVKCDSEVKCSDDLFSSLDSAVRGNLEQVMRKRSYSGSTDSSYDSDESLYPVEKEFKKFINEVNKKWLHFRPKTPPAAPPPPAAALPAHARFAVEVASARAAPFRTADMTLAALRAGQAAPGATDARLDAIEVVPDLNDSLHKRNEILHNDAFLGLSQGGWYGSTTVRVSAAPEPLAPPPPRSPPAPPPPPPPPAARARPRPRPHPPPLPAAATLDTETHSTPPKKPQTPVKEKERDKARESEKEKQTPLIEDTGESLTQIIVEKKKQPESLTEMPTSGVVLRTVQSPLRKTVLAATARRDEPQILTVAVSDSLKVRLQNHLLSSQAGGSAATVVGLVQNGPFPTSGMMALPVHHSRDTAGSSSGGGSGGRRVAGAGAAAGGGGVLHVRPNKLKVLQRAPGHQVGVGRGSPLGGVVSLAALGEARAAPALLKPSAHSAHSAHSTHSAHSAHAAPPLTHFFEIKAGHLAKGPHLVNVVRGAVPARGPLGDGKRHLVTTIDAHALKGNISTVRSAPRVNVSVAPPPPPAAAPAPAPAPAAGGARAPPPALRAHPLRHQIQLKNRTFQVAPRGEASSSALVANLLHKNIHLPKGGQKIAISSGGGGVSANVQAIAFTAQQLKGRQARLVAPRQHSSAEAGAAAGVGAGAGAGAAAAAAAGGGAEAAGGAEAEGGEPVRRRANDTLPMEVT